MIAWIWTRIWIGAATVLIALLTVVLILALHIAKLVGFIGAKVIRKQE